MRAREGAYTARKGVGGNTQHARGGGREYTARELGWEGIRGTQGGVGGNTRHARGCGGEYAAREGDGVGYTHVRGVG